MLLNTLIVTILISMAVARVPLNECIYSVFDASSFNSTHVHNPSYLRDDECLVSLDTVREGLLPGPHPMSSENILSLLTQDSPPLGQLILSPVTPILRMVGPFLLKLPLVQAAISSLWKQCDFSMANTPEGVAFNNLMQSLSKAVAASPPKT